jgi:hypothetical protein
MTSSRKKGAYYLAKSIALLKEKGYSYTKLESNRRTVINGIPMWIHTDAFGSDILAMDDKEIIFIQVKFLADKTFHIQKCIDEFNKYKWCPSVKRQLWLWTTRKPVRIVEC